MARLLLRDGAPPLVTPVLHTSDANDPLHMKEVYILRELLYSAVQPVLRTIVKDHGYYQPGQLHTPSRRTSD